MDIVELLQNEYNRNWKSILTTLVNGFFGLQIILILFIYMRDFGLVVLSDREALSVMDSNDYVEDGFWCLDRLCQPESVWEF